MSNSSLQNVQVNPITGEIRINQLTWAVMFANVGAGVTASLWASPIMAVIDGSIINSINGDRRPILAYIKEGLKLLVRHPVTFLRQRWFLCLLCWQVYAGTYTATNCARSLCDVYNLSPEMTDVCKFGTAFVVNVGLSQVKDGSMVKYFTSNFAKSSASQALGSKTYSVPLRTRGLFLTRDAVTMFAAFCLADRLAHAIFDLSSHMLSYKSCSLLTNFVTPAALQPFSTVVHLWALEHAAAVSQGTSTLWKDVFPQIQKKYAISLFSRISRIIPSISIGNNVNNVMRSYLLTEFA